MPGDMGPGHSPGKGMMGLVPGSMLPRHPPSQTNGPYYAANGPVPPLVSANGPVSQSSPRYADYYWDRYPSHNM